MRVLDARKVTVREELRVVDHDGYRRLWFGEQLLADDSCDAVARVGAWALELGPLAGKSVAWIGGGFCIGPRLFAIADCQQTVFEIEPALKEFCPEGVEFIPGDWRDTISGKFDIVIFDLGGDPPYAELETFLKPGGVILPRGDE